MKQSNKPEREARIKYLQMVAGHVEPALQVQECKQLVHIELNFILVDLPVQRGNSDFEQSCRLCFISFGII